MGTRVNHDPRLVFIVTGHVGFFMVPCVFFMDFLMVPGLIFMIPGGFLSSLIVPGWCKSELSAAGAK